MLFVNGEIIHRHRANAKAVPQSIDGTGTDNAPDACLSSGLIDIKCTAAIDVKNLRIPVGSGIGDCGQVNDSLNAIKVRAQAGIIGNVNLMIICVLNEVLYIGFDVGFSFAVDDMDLMPLGQ